MTFLEGSPRPCVDCEHYGTIIASCKGGHRLPPPGQKCPHYFSLKVAPCSDCNSYQAIIVSCDRGHDLLTVGRHCQDYSGSGHQETVLPPLTETHPKIIHVDFNRGKRVL